MKFALQCPGQGSQSLGMLSDLAEQYEVVIEVFAEASKKLGYDLWSLVQQGPKKQLNETEFTQPALLAADVAVWRCWQQLGGPWPTLLSGHSLGEYAALVIAESLEFSAAIELVALRGREMQNAVAVGEGGMAAIIGLEEKVVSEICQDASKLGIVSPANFNSVGQVVISGQVEAVEEAIVLAKRQGATIATRIPVSVPSHCLLMQPAAERLKQKLATVNVCTPRIPVIHNVDVKTHESPEAIRNALVQQLVSPVRWVETVLAMESAGVELFIECGPGKVIAGLNKRITKSVPTYSINTVQSLRSTLERLKDAVK